MGPTVEELQRLIDHYQAEVQRVSDMLKAGIKPSGQDYQIGALAQMMIDRATADIKVLTEGGKK